MRMDDLAFLSEPAEFAVTNNKGKGKGLSLFHALLFQQRLKYRSTGKTRMDAV